VQHVGDVEHRVVAGSASASRRENAHFGLRGWNPPPTAGSRPGLGNGRKFERALDDGEPVPREPQVRITSG
jgi:hypothetical protein